ncbi:PLP-dependent aminotransferase family protein [Deinococcus deserti]|uniref:Putative Transcriptional regulator, GntR family n=1 Tax=Deinococcus deserti (strain DSM 17065 / CIP 109153 / LMG 22923 / VCD115) TaxID=546414 RepID=C1CVD7_DEIDV|nr:PLP-dependent aminotransferase family protein [Deinococcus deserti]ACO46154.1 putative Transcriptional regulator, GntR family [Deinococcus deserti VCD115]
MAGARVRTLSVPDLLPEQLGETLHARVARTLRLAVTQGYWPEGSRLPGHRVLAAQLGVSRNTLVDALEQLQTEGYVTAQGRSGTRVSAPLQSAGPEPHSAPLPLSAWAARALAGQEQDVGGDFAVDFRVGQPVPELYPEAAWMQALARRAGRSSAESHVLRDPLGPLETRRALAAYLNAERGARVTPGMVMLTGGTQSALDALARVFLEPGRTAAIEAPTYPGAWAALAATGAQVVDVPVDPLGLDPAALPERATLLYITPGCQYPTTVTLPFARQRALIDWAEHSGAFILEDDYAADLHHTGRPPAVMQGLAPHRVLLLGSFSKSLAPVTRSGFLVAPESVTRVLAGTRPLTDRVPGVLDALALGDILASGAYGRHLRRARQTLRHRHEVLIDALGAALPEWHATPARAGLHVYVSLPGKMTSAEAVAYAAGRGVALSPAGTTVRSHAVLMAFGHLEPHLIREGVARLL